MSETMTVYAEKPPPPPAHASQSTNNVASPPSQHFQHHFQSAHNTHYTGRHRSGGGTNRYAMQQRRREEREARERAEAEEAHRRFEAEEAQHRHNEENRLRQEQEARQRHEEDIRRREHEEWAAKHPLQAAEKWLNDANDNIRHKENERNHAEQQLRESENNLEHHRHRFTHSTNELNHLLANPPKGITFGSNSFKAELLNERHRVLDEIQHEINRLQEEVNHRRGHLDHCHHQLHEAHQNKSRAEQHLSNMREDIRREQQAEAERKAQAAEKLKEQEEAKSRAEKVARRKEQEETKKKPEETGRLSASLNAVGNDTGIPDEPLSVVLGNLAITPQSQTAPPLSRPVNDPRKQVAIMNSAAIPAIAAVGAGAGGVASLAGNTAAQVKNAIAALSRTATLTPAGAMATTVLAGLFPTEAGEGSDKPPGGKLFVKTLPATLFDMPSQEDLISAAETCRTIDVPLRGRLDIAEGEVRYELVKTVRPTPVTVIAGIPDGRGRYHCTLPATDDLPARTILINPANAPGITGPTATPSPAHGPQAITHTGGQTQPSGLPITTHYPDPGDITFNDLIVVPPLESGDKPVYVMLNNQPDFGVQAKDNSFSSSDATDTLESNRITDEKVTKAIIDANKFDYLFGNVTSNSHNTKRSNQLVRTMDRLGLESIEKGASILTDHFQKVVNTKNNVLDTYTKGNQKFEVRESLLFGPSGKATKLETSFEIMPDGSRRFITTIPKEGKK